jgi:hypothetical protein
VTNWTRKRINAALQAINAMLAGEEGEGDAEGITFDDLQAAAQRLREERDRLSGDRK